MLQVTVGLRRAPVQLILDDAFNSLRTPLFPWKRRTALV